MSKLNQQPNALKYDSNQLVSQSDQVWQILTILNSSNKQKKGASRKRNPYQSFYQRQNLVKKLSFHKRQDLECAKADVERQIEDSRIFVTILALFGVALSYLFEGSQLKGLVLAYFACSGIFIWIDVSRKNNFLSLLKQALASINC